ncbi:MAG: hypothetical protein JWP99_1236, partial [Devosia sp.]|nr:hypothetical protein [Devosia sp.]
MTDAPTKLNVVGASRLSPTQRRLVTGLTHVALLGAS